MNMRGDDLPMLIPEPRAPHRRDAVSRSSFHSIMEICLSGCGLLQEGGETGSRPRGVWNVRPNALHPARLRSGLVLVLMLALLMSAGLRSRASEQTARLRESLQSDHLYRVTTIGALDRELAQDRAAFRKEFDGRYVALSGDIREIGKNGDSAILADEEGRSCAVNVDGRETRALLKTFAVGAHLTVYGRLEVKGLLGDSCQIAAEGLSTKEKTDPAIGEYVFYQGTVYHGKRVEDLREDGSVGVYIPSSWDTAYVRTKLTNNGVRGYQFYLNAIPPQNREYPEIFDIFYFVNETYLEKPPREASDSENRRIEEAIIRNILKDDKSEWKLKVETIRDAAGNQLDYCSTTYRSKDRNDYRLEFLFRPDKKGITCMLYLYYPSDAAVNHLRDVTYVVETMETGED